jgi:thioredoxin 1
MAVANLVKVTDADFAQEIEQHPGVALVDFWAVWCGPCQMVAPIVEQIAKDYEGKVKVAKLDVDENPQTTMRYNVRSIPSLLIFKGGKHVETVVGAVPKAYLVEKLSRHLS